MQIAPIHADLCVQHLLSERLHLSDNGGTAGVPLKPLRDDSALRAISRCPHYAERHSLSDSKCWNGGNKWVNWLPMMPRGVSLSDGCTSDCCSFSSLASTPNCAMRIIRIHSQVQMMVVHTLGSPKAVCQD